jgi:hypothetical protein
MENTMMRDFLERRQLRKAFSKFLGKEQIDDLLSGKSIDDGKLRGGIIEFLLVAVQGQSAEHISERMGAVAEVALDHDAFVDSLISSLVVIVYGVLHFSDRPKGDRPTLARSLEQRFDNQIKIIHGTRFGHFGNLGGRSGQRWSYSFIIPGFLDALAALSKMNFGETMEFTAEEEIV